MQSSAAASSSLENLRGVESSVSELVHAIPRVAWRYATPCDGWDVSDLVRHMVAGKWTYRELISGSGRDPDQLLLAAREPTDSELPLVYDRSVNDLLAAYGVAGAMQSEVTVFFGPISAERAVDMLVVEAITHGWDLATALGQNLAVDPEVADRALRVAGELVTQLPEGPSPFGTPQPVAEDASNTVRLVALLGRTVTAVGR